MVLVFTGTGLVEDVDVIGEGILGCSTGLGEADEVGDVVIGFVASTGVEGFG